MGSARLGNSNGALAEPKARARPRAPAEGLSAIGKVCSGFPLNRATKKEAFGNPSWVDVVASVQ